MDVSRVDLFLEESFKGQRKVLASGHGPRVDEMDNLVGNLQDVTKDTEDVVAQKVVEKDKGDLLFEQSQVGGLFVREFLVERLVVRIAEDAILNESEKGPDEVQRIGKDSQEVLRIDEFVELVIVVREELDARIIVDGQQLNLKVESKRRHR